MNDVTDTSEPRGPEPRASWEPPVISLVGTIALVVRGGSAMGKQTGNHDGDAGNFQCFPGTCNPG